MRIIGHKSPVLRSHLGPYLTKLQDSLRPPRRDLIELDGQDLRWLPIKNRKAPRSGLWVCKSHGRSCVRPRHISLLRDDQPTCYFIC